MEKNVFRAVQEIRVALSEMDIKKTGHNDYSHYDYFELSDFLPAIQKLCLDKNIICIYEINESKAKLLIKDIDSVEGGLVFEIPIAELNLKGANAIQNVGGLTTYTRRYLYMIAFEIAENEEFDISQDNGKKEEIKNINNQLITDKDVNALEVLTKKKGVSPESILGRYNVNTYNEMNFEQFNNAMRILNKMKDIDADGVQG